MLGSEHLWEGAEFLNYWNLNQCFLLEGKSTQELIDRFLKVVQLQNPGCKVIRQELGTKDFVNCEVKAQIKWLAA